MNTKIKERRMASITEVLVMVLFILVSFVIIFANNDVQMIDAEAVNGETYAKAKAGVNTDFVPGVDISKLYAVTGGNFSAGINKYPSKPEGVVVPMTASGTTRILWGNYASNYCFSGIKFQPKDTSNDTAIKYIYNGNRTSVVQKWCYIYTFLELPSDLTANGGTLNAKGKAYAFSNTGQSNAYFSIVAGTALNDKKASGIVMNKSTGKTQTITAKSGVTKPSKDIEEDINLSIDIRPGDKYARVSFVHLISELKSQNCNLQSKLQNVEITYSPNKTTDVEAPTLTMVEDKSLAVGKKEILIDVLDASGIASVKNGEADLAKVSGDDKRARYSMTVTDNKAKQITVTDTYGNAKTYEVNAVNLITAGDGVVVSDVKGNSLTITRKLATYNTMLGDPVTKGKATKVYNFGIEARYAVTYDLNEDVSETIEISAPDKTLNVNIDGKENKVAYGTSFTLNADPSKGDFVGWYNERGGMVSKSAEYTIAKVVTNMKFTAKYVTPSVLNVTFVDISGGIIDKQSFDSMAELDKILSSPNGTYVNVEETAYMRFSRFIKTKDDKNGNVTILAAMTTAQQFTVRIGMYEKKYYYNQLAIYMDAPNGWGIRAIDGTVSKVTSDSTYSFYVVSDVDLVRLDYGEELDDMSMTATKTDVKGQQVISMNGFVNADKPYSEVGFVFSNASEYLTADNFILENVDTMRISVANTKGGQYILNVDANTFEGAKVRMYIIDSLGNVTYSRIFSLVNVRGISK